MSVSLTAKARKSAALVVVCVSLFLFSSTVAAQVTLYPTTSPSSVQAGVQIVTLTGFGFPDGNIHPTDVKVQLTPVSSGSSAQATALEATRITGSTVRIRFTVPSTLHVDASTAYNVAISGQTYDQVKFVSSNFSQLTVIPASSITLSPSEAESGSTLWVDVVGAQTDFVDGVTYARFGAGASVGTSALGDYGLVSVTSPTAARALVKIDPSAAPGTRTVVVLTGAQQASAAFSVLSPHQPPVADAGPQQLVKPGALVQLDGSRSTSPSGAPLQYFWSFVSVPTGSKATLAHNDSVNPTFTTDLAGDYVVQLTVNDGTASTTASVTITMQDTAPVANAGFDQTVQPNTLVQLDGSGSTDADGDQLTYSWTLKARPQGSAAVLADASTVTPHFLVDALGAYVLELKVDDGHGNSASATVNVSTSNQAPKADAGANVTATIGSLIRLDGSRSSDPDNDPLTYSWILISRPQGSAASILDSSSVTPGIVPDVAGNYVAQLTVNDQHNHSAVATVAISTENSAPVANAGPDQSVKVGERVYLSGSASYDPDGDLLTYSWSLLAKPAGSVAALSSSNTVNSSFVPDMAGDYVAQLIVGDPTSKSAPSTLLVMVTAAKPAVDPQSLNFGQQAITVTSGSRSVLVTNTTSAPITVNAVGVTGPDAAEFQATSPALPMQVPAGGSTSFNVTFTPVAPGSRSAKLVVDKGPAGTDAIQLAGTGVSSAAISYTPGNISFPDQPVSTASAAVPVTLTNIGTDPLVISSFSLSGPTPQDFGFSSENLPITIDPGAGTTINVTFTPQAAGSRSAVLLITSNASGSPHAVTLSGSGLAPVFGVSPSSVLFADQALNKPSSPAVVSVKNSGTAPMVITAVSVSGANKSEFVVTADPLPITINPGANTLLSVVFTPTATGSRAASLDITENIGGIHSVPMSGKGITLPAIQLLSSSVDFGDVEVGKSSTQNLQVKNTGSANLVISALSFGGGNPNDFNGSANTLPITIAPGATGNVKVTFTPATTGPRAGSVTLTHNATGLAAATLEGNGTAPAVSLSVSNLNFGDQLIHTTSAAKTVSVTNNGTANLVINSFSISGPAAAEFASTTATPITIAAGNSAAISLKFTPGSTGARTATLSINDTATGSPHTVTLSGTGTAPEISVSPADLQFNNQRIGTTSTALPVTISNPGTSELTISALSISGPNAAEFALSAPATPIKIAAKASVTVNITFKPTAKDLRTATLTISNDAGPNKTVSLSGSGVTGDTKVTLSPSMLDLGTIPVGKSSPAKSVVITNSGSVTLQVTKIEATGANAAEFTFTSAPLPFAVSPGGFATVSVSFKPQAVGTRTASLVFTSNAEGSPHSVSVTGKGQGVPQIDMPSSTDFGNQNVGKPSAPKSLVVGNKGTDDLIITSVTFTGTSAAEFSTTVTVPITVAAQSNVSIPVVFTPTNTGTRSTSIRIVSNSAGSPHLSPLSGVGTRPILTASPLSLDFGDRAVSTTSSPSVLTLKNSGTGVLTISALALAGTNSTDFGFSGTTLPVQIQPNSSISVNVTFSPKDTGNRSATLNITHDAAGSPTPIPLKGNGTPNGPLAAVSPSSLNFGNQSLSDPPASKTITVTNNGNQELTISAITTTGANASDFTPTFAGALPLKVAAGAHVAIQVAFKPGAKGSRVANLSISHNASNSPSLVALSGTGTAPEISVQPAALDFGKVSTTGPGSTKSLVITNSGTAPLSVSNLVISGTDAARFSITSGAAPATIAPGGTLTVGITFKPKNGPNVAALTISHNAAGAPVIVNLTGEGAVIGSTTINIPSSLAFGLVATNATSTKPVAISNIGGANLVISSIAISGANASDFTFTSGALPLTVSPGGTIAISVTFAPKDTGNRTAVLTVTDNATGSPHPVQLSGSGFINGPALKLDQANLQFPDQLKNTSSQPLSIVITNPGNQNLSISSLAISGTNPSDFSISPFTLPIVVAANGGTRTISITFTPTDFGARAATLVIRSNAPTNPVNVPLSGTGTGPIIAFVPDVNQAPLDFGNQAVLTTSSTKQLTIKNIGTGNLTITNLNIPASQFTLDPVQFPLVVAANQSVTLNITFSPTAAQTYNTALNISDNASGAPHSYALKGTGVFSQMTFMPSEKLDLGSQALGGTSAPKPVALINSSNVPLVITNVTVTGTNAGDFNLSPPALPAVIDPGKNLSLTLTFTPGAKGARSASLAVTNNTAASPQTLPITGTGAGPIFNATPNPISFGATIVGAPSAGVDLVISNTGDAPLIINAASITGTNAGDFAAPMGPFPFSIAPGAQNALHVSAKFTPTNTGNRSATLSISHNASPTATVIPLTGVGVPPPQITPSTGTVTFGNQFLNTTSAPRSVTLTNTGGSTLVISGFTISGSQASDFALTSGVLPINVNPGGSTTISVTFTPAGPPIAPSLRSAAISIASNVPGAPAVIALNGTAIGEAKFALNPNPLVFGNQSVGSASAPAALQISNPGTADLHITNITVGGTNAGDFSVPNPGLPITVVGGQSKSINVVFTPTTTGPRSATITFTDDGTANPHVLPVSGTGVQPVIKLTPTNNTVAFGNQVVPEPSAPKTLKIENIGTADLIITGLAVSGPQAGEFTFVQSLPVTINPTKSLELNIIFTPLQAGSRQAILTISHNAGSPVSAALSGTGTKPNLTFTPNNPASKDFGTVVVGDTTTPPFSVTVGNSGTGPLSVSAIALTGANPADFVLTAPALPATVSPGSTLPITVAFKPTADGARSASISVTSNSDGSPHLFALTGTGKTVSKLSLSTSAVTFPNQLVDTTSNPTQLTVTNTGSANLVITALNLTGAQPTEFTVTPPSQLPLTIAPTASVQLGITFKPASLKPSTTRTATLGIVSNAASSPDNVSLSGTAFGMAKLTAPALVDVGGQRLNTAGGPYPINIQNTGSDDLHITSLSISGTNAAMFTIPAGLAPTTVVPGASLIVNLTFTPTAVGEKTANLNINDDAAGSPHVVPLKGTGTFPAITTTPANTLDFGEQNVGISSSPLPLKINNTGTADLVISALSFAGTNPGDFTLVPVTLPLTITPGQSATINLSFRPPATGARSGFINITHNAPGTILSVALTGNGVRPAFQSVPSNPNGLSFGTVAVGATSAAKNIAVTNTGTGPLVITALQFIGNNPGDFAVSQQTMQLLPLTIPASQTVQIPVTFTPTAKGDRNASLRFTDNAIDSPQTVGVAGSGVQGALNVITVPATLPPVVSFGNQAVNNTSAAKTITFQNSGAVDINITAMSFAGSEATEFAFSPAPQFPIKIAPSASVSVNITFTPKAGGSRNATVQLTHDAEGPTSIALNGVGTQPGITAPSSFAFGNQAVGNAIQKQITITNPGNGDLVISALTISGANAGDFSASPAVGTLPITIQPTKNATLNLNFTPGAEGARTGTLNIAHNAPGSPTQVQLTGTGVTPIFSAPASLTFQTPQNLGEQTTPLTLTVTNTGNGDLTITAINLSGTNAVDFQLGTLTLPVTITPQGTLPIPVTFKPNSGTGPRSATVVFQDNANGSPHSVTLAGTAIGPVFSPSTTTLSFGSVNLTGAPPQLPLNINNTGTGDLVITSIQVAGDPNIIGDYTPSFAALPIRITPGQKTTVMVTFAPKKTGARPATLVFTDNALDSPQTITLSGTGTGPQFQGPANQPVEFGTQRVNTNSQIILVPVQNTGNATMVISSTKTAGDAASDFLLAGAPTSIAAGATANVQVIFRPTSSSPLDRNAYISFVDNALGSPHKIDLHGKVAVDVKFVTPPQLTVGYNLETIGGISLTAATPNDLPVTITSSDQNLVLLSSDLTGMSGGSKSINVTIPADQDHVSFYVQGLASSGTATLTFSSTGLTSVSVGVQLRPSGFIVSGPAGIDTPFTAVVGGNDSQLTVFPRMLNTDGSYSDSGKIRGGYNVPVTLTTVDSNVGTIAGVASFIAGSTLSGGAKFHAVGPGSTTINVVQPAGFTAPTSGTSLTASVTAPYIKINPATVGANLLVQGIGTIDAPAPSNGLSVTLTSLSPNLVTLSTSPSAAGSASITLIVPGGSTTLPAFYISGMQSPNTSAHITATATGYADGGDIVANPDPHYGDIAVTPSGFVIAGPGLTAGQNFETTTISTNSRLTVSVQRLDPSGNPVSDGILRPGISPFSVPLTSSNTTVGKITVSSVTFSAGGTSNSSAFFQPLAQGTTTLSTGTPTLAGFTAPASGKSIVVTVTQPAIEFSLATNSIGVNLQESASGRLTAAAPTNLQVTIQSNNNLVVISTNPALAGATSTTLTVPQGQGLDGSGFPSFYVQALPGSVGQSATITMSASGFTSASTTVTVTPSGFVLVSPNGLGQNFSSLGGLDTALTVTARQLQPGTLVPQAIQGVRGGIVLPPNKFPVTIVSNTPSIGIVSDGPANFDPGASSVIVHFTASSSTKGTTLLQITQPSGFSIPSTGGSLSATVN